MPALVLKTELPKIFGQLFSLGKSYVFILTKNGLGDILGDFPEKNSSGHPA
jgi:hypothetical protein